MLSYTRLANDLDAAAIAARPATSSRSIRGVRHRRHDRRGPRPTTCAARARACSSTTSSRSPTSTRARRTRSRRLGQRSRRRAAARGARPRARDRLAPYRPRRRDRAPHVDRAARADRRHAAAAALRRDRPCPRGRVQLSAAGRPTRGPGQGLHRRPGRVRRRAVGPRLQERLLAEDDRTKAADLRVREHYAVQARLYAIAADRMRGRRKLAGLLFMFIRHGLVVPVRLGDDTLAAGPSGSRTSRCRRPGRDRAPAPRGTLRSQFEPIAGSDLFRRLGVVRAAAISATPGSTSRRSWSPPTSGGSAPAIIPRRSRSSCSR